jgi:hypothetical protein
MHRTTVVALALAVSTAAFAVAASWLSGATAAWQPIAALLRCLPAHLAYGRLPPGQTVPAPTPSPSPPPAPSWPLTFLAIADFAGGIVEVDPEAPAWQQMEPDASWPSLLDVLAADAADGRTALVRLNAWSRHALMSRCFEQAASMQRAQTRLTDQAAGVPSSGSRVGESAPAAGNVRDNGAGSREELTMSQALLRLQQQYQAVYRCTTGLTPRRRAVVTALRVGMEALQGGATIGVGTGGWPQAPESLALAHRVRQLAAAVSRIAADARAYATQAWQCVTLADDVRYDAYQFLSTANTSIGMCAAQWQREAALASAAPAAGGVDGRPGPAATWGLSDELPSQRTVGKHQGNDWVELAAVPGQVVSMHDEPEHAQAWASEAGGQPVATAAPLMPTSPAVNPAEVLDMADWLADAATSSASACAHSLPCLGIALHAAAQLLDLAAAGDGAHPDGGSTACGVAVSSQRGGDRQLPACSGRTIEGAGGSRTTAHDAVYDALQGAVADARQAAALCNKLAARVGTACNRVATAAANDGAAHGSGDGSGDGSSDDSAHAQAVISRLAVTASYELQRAYDMDDAEPARAYSGRRGPPMG